MKITINVGDINHLNRTVKERACGVVTHLPCKKLPGRMVIDLVHLCAFWINEFPPGLKIIHPTMSPRAILTGLEVDFNNHCSSSSENTSILTKSMTTQWPLALVQKLQCGQLLMLKVGIIL